MFVYHKDLWVQTNERKPIMELSPQLWEFSSYTEDSFDKYLSGDLFYFFK